MSQQFEQPRQKSSFLARLARPAKSRLIGGIANRTMEWGIAATLMVSVLATIVPAFAQGPAQRKGPGKAVSPREIAFITRCTLQNVDTQWIFDKTPPPGEALQFGRRQIGMFLGGAQGARYSLGFVKCIGELTGTNWRFLSETGRKQLYFGGLVESISDLSGLPIYSSKQGGQKASSEVNYYNPALIRWARQNLIPGPREKIVGLVSYQEIYDKVFSRSARILYRTDRFLREKNPENKGTRFETYLKIYSKGDYAVRTGIRTEFDAVYKDRHLGPDVDPYNYNFSAGHAATFWLRRGMDDTVQEVRALLAAVLRQYDPAELKRP